MLGAALGFAFYKASGSDKKGCAGVPCMVIGSTALGTGFGYLLGRQSDRTYYVRYRGVAPLDVASTSVELAGEPVAFDIADRTIAVGGSAGAEILDAERPMHALGLRGEGLRSIGTVSLAPASGWLTLGSPNGLYLFPPLRGPGLLVRSGDVASAVSTSRNVYFGVGNRIEIAPLANDTTRQWPGVMLDGAAHSLAIDSARGLLWAVTDRQLIGFRLAGDSLVRVGATAIDGAGRRLALTHDTAAVALGERGVQLFDTSDPTAPRPLAQWGIAHFAYDVSFDRGRLFVAAGPEGVYVLDVSSGTLRTLGLARGLGFASALASHDGYTYILDRRTNALRRIDSEF